MKGVGFMPCYHPIRAYRSKSGRNENGKWPIVFNLREGYLDMPVDIPCGQCIGCRLERSRQWAIRCMHEASLYNDNCFLTLTYNDDNLPANGSLVKRDLTLFFKRLRKRYGKGIRYYACGEYGELYNRPHFHVCLFNKDFKDKYFWIRNHGYNLYRSPILEELWPYGYITIGAVTFESAAYVARYIMKKQLGKGASDYYASLGLVPEYTVMSRRPGIATGWFEKYAKEVYPRDEVVIRKVLCKPPRFYDQKFDLTNHEDMVKIKARRKKLALTHADDNDPDRRYVKEKCKLAKISKLLRPLEYL